MQSRRPELRGIMGSMHPKSPPQRPALSTCGSYMHAYAVYAYTEAAKCEPREQSKTGTNNSEWPLRAREEGVREGKKEGESP